MSRSCRLDAGRRPGVARGEDPPVHRGQMGGEDHLGPARLLDLRGMAVREQPVGGEILVHRVEVGVGLGRPTGAGDPAGGIHHDPGRLDGAVPHEGGDGQRGRRRVTPGRRHQGGPGQLVAKQLGDAEGGLVEELRVGMLGAVPGGVQGGVAKPEVGRQIDDDPDPLAQLRDQVLGRAVGQGEKDQVEPVGRVGVSRVEGHVGIGGGQARVEVRYPPAGLGVCGGEHHVRGWDGRRPGASAPLRHSPTRRTPRPLATWTWA